MGPIRLVAALLVMAVMAGCSAGNSDLIPVSGKVLQNGQPLATGTVSFRPDATKGNTSQHHPTGVIDADGRYVLYTAEQSGAPPGWYKVVVFASSQLDDKGEAHPGLPVSIIDVRYNDPATSPLAIEVKPDSSSEAYDLRLEK